jgi:hypothetical protein
VYALYDCMTDLSFVTDPPFDFPDGAGGGGVSDAAFIKATRTIGGRDTVEEYMACGLLLQSMSFELGEVADGEMPVSKLPVQMLDFWSPDLQRRLTVSFVRGWNWLQLTSSGDTPVGNIRLASKLYQTKVG